MPRSKWRSANFPVLFPRKLSVFVDFRWPASCSCRTKVFQRRTSKEYVCFTSFNNDLNHEMMIFLWYWIKITIQKFPHLSSALQSVKRILPKLLELLFIDSYFLPFLSGMALETFYSTTQERWLLSKLNVLFSLCFLASSFKLAMLYYIRVSVFYLLASCTYFSFGKLLIAQLIYRLFYRNNFRFW